MFESQFNRTAADRLRGRRQPPKVVSICSFSVLQIRQKSYAVFCNYLSILILMAEDSDCEGETFPLPDILPSKRRKATESDNRSTSEIEKIIRSGMLTTRKVAGRALYWAVLERVAQYDSDGNSKSLDFVCCSKCRKVLLHNSKFGSVQFSRHIEICSPATTHIPITSFMNAKVTADQRRVVAEAAAM